MNPRLAVLVVALLVGAGCSFGDTFADNGTVPATLGEQDVIGIWGGHDSSARYELRADHTFTATSVPASQLARDPAAQPTEAGPFHGDGTWEQSAGPDLGTNGVTMKFAQVLDAHDIPLAGTWRIVLMTGQETVSPDKQYLLELPDDYLTKVD